METIDPEAATYFPFLQLPREIRDEIYSILLHPEVEPIRLDEITLGPDPGAPQDRRWPVHVHQYHSGRHKAFDPAALPEIGFLVCQGLRLANRQLSDEVSDAVKLLNPDGGAYKLDIVIHDHLLCLRWMALPTPLRDLRHVVVDLRIFSDRAWSGSGGPGPHFQALLRLLTTFLRTGPSLSENQSMLPQLKVDSITVNVVDYRESEALTPGGYSTSQRIWVWLRMLALSGALFGRVGVLRFHVKNKEDEWVIEDKGDTSRMTAGWKKYGWTL
ncbi:hypothetical protein MMC34_002036 [Xylographa carneopallida]|nr:hypothetical protein [Xylographa carneopallida]